MNSILLPDTAFFVDFVSIELTSRLLTATWQGGLLLTVVLLLCRCCQSLTSQARCWIWRLAFAKFILILIIGNVVCLPILPSAKHAPTLPAVTATLNHLQGESQPHLAGNYAALRTRPLGMETSSAHLGNLAETSNRITETTNVRSPGLPTATPSVWQLVAISWFIGMTVSLIAVLRQWLVARKLSRQSTLVSCPTTRRIYQSLCRKYNVGSIQPILATTLRGKTPMLVGVWRPRILLPKSLLGTLGDNELKLVLAHELAHVARRDLLWNLLVVVVRVCFFFHPLVWIGQSRYALDQEMACDQLALRTTRSGIKDYGNLLLKCSSVSGGATQTWATVGVISSFNSLKKRIIEMGKKRNNTLGAAIASLAAIALCMLLATPVQLVAQQEDSTTTAESKPAKSVQLKPAAVTQTPQAKIPVKVKQSRREPEMRVFATGREQDKQTRQSTQRSTSRSTRSRPSVGSTSSELRDKYAPLTKAATRKTERSDVSVSVNNNGVSESINVQWNDDNYVDVEYSTNQSGKTVTRKHQLGDIKSLKKTDVDAHRFYQKHVTASGNRDALATRAQVGSGLGIAERSVGIAPRPRSTGSSSGSYEKPPRSNSNSASNSSWSSSASGQNSLTGRNTVRSSGGSNRSNGGGQAHEAMMKHIRQMRDQAEDPQTREVWDRMLKQSQNGGK